MADPTFVLVATNPFGLSAGDTYPALRLVDIDADGDLDAFVSGNAGNTAVYTNVGTSASPTFSLLGTNAYGLADAGANARPAFADVDGDGDLDLFLTTSTGAIYYYRNDGSSASASFALAGTNAFGLGPGSAVTTPALGDLDGDGDLDAIVGIGNGNFVVYTNTGSTTAPTFVSAGTNAFGLGDVGAWATLALTDLDGDGDLDVLAAANTGSTYLFRNGGSTTAPTFVLEATNPFGLTAFGTSLVPEVQDIDGDGDLDALIATGTDLYLFLQGAPPAAPGTPDLAAASDSGASSTDNLTNATTPTLNGTAEAGATVVVSDGAVAMGTATADATTGAWTLTLGSLSDRTMSLTARAINAFGTSDASAALSVTIDTTAPSPPQAVALDTASDSGTQWDGLTNVATPAITGASAEAATVVLYDGATAVGTTSVAGMEFWTITAASLADAAHSLTAVLIDAAGNTSTPSSAVSVTIDTTASAPTGLALDAASDSGTTGDGITSATAPTITGTVAEAGTVILYDGATALGTATAAAAGAWTITPASLADATHTLTARLTDAAANTSAASAALSVTIDTAAAAPTGLALDAASDSGTVGDGVTSDATPTITGTVAEAGTIVLYDGATAVGTTTAAGPGAWTITAPSLADATHSLTAVLTDAAGNTSTAAAALAVTIDTTVPAPPASGGDSGGTTTVTPVSQTPVTVTSTQTSTTTVDGVAVQEVRLTTSTGAVIEVIDVPVVTADRTDADFASAEADIPLAQDAATGQTTLLASVPVGVGLRAEGVTTTQTPAAALSGLVQAIQARTAGSTTDQAAMSGVGQSFLGSLPDDSQLSVRTIVPTVAVGTAAPTAPLVITGSTPEGSTAREALVIDASGLPPGTVIQLENVAFAAVVGAVQVTGGAGSQTVVGDSGAQYIVLGADDDTLRGGDGNDYVGSRDGDDVLFGDGGADTVEGGAGNDALYGNQQDDVLYGNAGQDTPFGGQDSDTLYGNLDGDAVYGQRGADVVHGNKGADTLFGGQDDDSLFGGQDDDLLYGGLGDDVLEGDMGTDTLWGGGGADRFVVRSPGDGADRIADFESGTDTIAVVGPNFGAIPAGTLSAGHFALGAPGDADDWFVFDTTTGVLSFDADGSGAGAAVAIATLDTRTLAHSDITVLAG